MFYIYVSDSRTLNTTPNENFYLNFFSFLTFDKASKSLSSHVHFLVLNKLDEYAAMGVIYFRSYNSGRVFYNNCQQQCDIAFLIFSIVF